MTGKSPSRSIVANFGLLSLPEHEQPAAGAADTTPVARPARATAGIIGAAQRSLTEIRQEHDRLQAMVARGGWQELNPDLIDSSPFEDRLPDDTNDEFDVLLKSIEQEGQRLPVQVRTHPTEPGRYQLVYGKRRWRVATKLQRSLKAIIVELSDAELAIVQGLENSARQNLTWIERALFAQHMADAGVKTRDIKSALSVDDSDLARYRHIRQTLSREFIEAIGRAPKAGRPRWMALSAAVASDPNAIAKIRDALAAGDLPSSDARFQAAFAALTKPNSRESHTPEVELRTSSGRLLGKAIFGRDIRLAVAATETSFRQFLRDALPELIERFASHEDGQHGRSDTS